jgi:signal transduction histidine kinase/ActR/RegA family two-component response regulator
MDEHRRPETGSWRDQLLLTLTHWGAIFGGVIAIGVTIRALAFDFVDVSHPAFAAMFVGYGAILALRLRPGLPYHVRAVTLAAACFIAAGGAILLRGLAPAPVLLVGLGVLIAALFLGRAGMLGGLLLAGAIVAIVGRPEPAEAFNPWSNAIDVVCVAGVLTVLVQFVVSRLERSLEHSSQALERLQSEQALREHAQDQLTRAQATLQQTQKLDAVGRLTGGVAHDFNNTLQVVLGWTEFLRSETNPQQIQDGIEQIRASAERSRGLTRQLLAFSRPELNQPTRVELHTFLPALIKSYRRLLPDDISIVAHTVEGLAILMDEGHLSQVLLNIVLNARDAMPAGGTIAVMAKFIPRAELPSTADGFDNGAVEIEIIDTGTGMDEETRSRVFEPFFTTKGKRGTALGLATAYGVVQLARGVIDIHSERGKGTSVRLIFPALTGSADAPLSGRPASLRSAEQAVLLAEDDPAVRTTLARALRQAGHRVVEVSDVEAGRVVVRERGAEFDVLVTDGIMPGGSTRQLIDDFLTARPNARVIICSGYIEDELSIRDLGEQTFEFVQKPFSPSELVARLGSATQSRKVTVPADR